MKQSTLPRGRYKDLVGNRYGHLVVLGFAYSNPKSHWYCRCDCGLEKIIRVDALKIVKSCGCFAREKSTTHGMSKTRFHKIYQKMLARCTSRTDPAYQLYGGRGIRVKWLAFQDFREDMYDSYLAHCASYGEDNTTIDRIDNDGHYSKENCRWATRKLQAVNRRNTRYLTVNKITHTVEMWAQLSGLSKRTINTRLDRGWPIDESLFQKPVPYGRRRG